MNQSNFNNGNWSAPYQFRSGQSSPQTIQRWGCKHKAGIYVIRDEFDAQTLYVGKAEGTSWDIESRLVSHLTDCQIPGKQGNKGIGYLVNHGQTVTVRWAESTNPTLSESIAIIQLEPMFNKRSQWTGIDRSNTQQVLSESRRLGLTPATQHLNPQDQAFIAKVDQWMREAEVEARVAQSNLTLQEKLSLLDQDPPNPKVYQERYASAQPKPTPPSQPGPSVS